MKRKARILVVSPLYPPHVGGLESHAEAWNRHLAQLGYTITVLTPLTGAGGALEERKAAVHILRYPAFEVIPNWSVPKIWRPLFWRQVRRALQKQPHLFVSRTRFFTATALALLLAQVQGRPLLHIEHGSNYVHLTNPLLNRFAHWYDATMGTLIFKKATVVVANSTASAQFVKHLSGRTVPVITRGIDHELINTTPSHPRKESSNQNNTCHIIFAGRLIAGKGINDLLTAVSKLTTAAWHLTILGTGPQTAELHQRVVDLKLTSRVHFVGQKSTQETIAYLKSADIFVHPSYTEGLPTAVLEAALCRLAIIATDVGGTKEIVTSTEAVLIPPGNIPKLIEALNYLLNNSSERARLGEAAYKANENRFQWAEAIHQYDKLICAALSAK